MSVSAPLSVAIVGTGMIGAVHVRAARDAGAQVTGVLGSSPERSEEYARRWGISRAHPDLDDLVAARPDVVHVCTPNASHHHYARALLEAGLHVICEKPLATGAAEAEELAAVAARTGLVAAVPFVYRYHPLVREIRARRIRGDFGDLNLVHGSYLQDWLLDPDTSSWRVSAAHGGPSRAFGDIGSHWCDLVEFVTGERFTEVIATTHTAYPTRPEPTGPSFSGATAGAARITVDTEDSVTAMFTTSGGIPVSTVVSQVAAGHKNRLWFELDGSRGSAAFDQENPEQIWLGTADGALTLRRGEGALSADQRRLTRVPAGHAQGYPDAFAAFLADSYAAVRGEAPEGLPTFDDGVRSARIVDAVLASARDRAWTAIP